MRSTFVTLGFLLLAAGSLQASVDYTARKDVQDAFDLEFGKTSWRTWSDQGTVLRSLIGKTSVVPDARKNGTVRSRLWRYLGVQKEEELRVDTKRSVATDETAHYEFTQVLADGRAVENTLVIIDVDQSDQIVGVVNQAVKNLQSLPSAPLISAAAAKCFAAADLLG